MSSATTALFLFLAAVSVDSLTAGLTYGTQRVRIKLPAYLILVCIPAAFVTAANRVGSYIFLLLPETVLPVPALLHSGYLHLQKNTEAYSDLMSFQNAWDG